MADVSTLVSLLPYPLDLDRPTCIPSNFFIPANKEIGEIEFIHIPRCYMDIYIDGDRGYQRVPLLSEDMAMSLVHDHVFSCIEVSQGIAQPGIFYVPRQVGDTVTDKVTYQLAKQKIKKECSKEINEALEFQKNWFVRLVAQADHDWARFRSPKIISDLQRRAANFLNLKKEWDIAEVSASIAKCPACKEYVNTGAVKCGKCGFIIDESEYKKIKDRFVQV